MEPIDFLRLHPPFNALDEAQLERLRGAVTVVEHAPGSRVVPPREGEVLHVLRQGVVRLERDGLPLVELEEGDPFILSLPHAGPAAALDAFAAEAAIEYRIAPEVSRILLERPDFATFFAHQLAQRLRLARAQATASQGDELRGAVTQLIRQPPVAVAADVPVHDAATTMTEHNVSSVLVTGDALGIVTDRDLRRRVLAAGLDPSTPVGTVATRPVHTLEQDASVFEAMLIMLQRNIHHVPIERGGAIVGVVTDTDVLRHQARAPFYLRGRLARLDDPRHLEGYAAEMTDAVEQMMRAGVDATQIGRVVSALNDAVVRALLALAEQELGPPPCAYTWLALGSEGRSEQTLLTDQDNALVYGDDAPGGEEYFAELAERVVTGLVTAGIPLCPGEVMATKQRATLAQWCDRFRAWRAAPDSQALLEVSIFFDFRAIEGGVDLTPLHAVVEEAAADGIFLARMAAAALTFRPPIGRFGRLHDTHGSIDVKAGGLLPIVLLARVMALRARSTARRTIDRLDAAAQARILSHEGAETMTEAYRFLLQLRLREQLRLLRAGEPASNRIDVGRLAPLDRRHLKDVFAAIREQQEFLATQFGMAGQ